MKPLHRRHWLATVASVSAAGLGSVLAQTSTAPRLVEITARRFEYLPAEIRLTLGEPVVIAVTSLDFIHGMHLPDLGKRFDLVPGRVTRFELQPTQAGVIEFLCDNFCGDEHEDMHGRFVVSP